MTVVKVEHHIFLLLVEEWVELVLWNVHTYEHLIIRIVFLLSLLSLEHLKKDAAQGNHLVDLAKSRHFFILIKLFLVVGGAFHVSFALHRDRPSYRVKRLAAHD